MDPRIKKTRNALRVAMLALIDENDYDGITVQEVCSKANISRSSFYLHFRDKDDLLISGFEEIGVNSADDIFTANIEANCYPNFAIVLFRGAEKNRAISRTCLCGKPGNTAAYHMRNLLVIRTREWIKDSNPNLSFIDLESAVHFLSSALQGLLTWWVNSDFPYTAEIMSDKFNTLAISGLDGSLHLYN